MSKSLRVCSAGLIAGVLLAGCNQDQQTPKPSPTSTASSSGTVTSSVKGAATLSWEAPTTNTNGTALTNLAGYRIYYGTSATDLSQAIELNGVGLQTYVIDNLGAGTWFFAVRAVTSAGVESALSTVVSKTIS